MHGWRMVHKPNFMLRASLFKIQLHLAVDNTTNSVIEAETATLDFHANFNVKVLVSKTTARASLFPVMLGDIGNVDVKLA